MERDEFDKKYSGYVVDFEKANSLSEDNDQRLSVTRILIKKHLEVWLNLIDSRSANLDKAKYSLDTLEFNGILLSPAAQRTRKLDHVLDSEELEF
jgi:hypothetical protein